MKNSNLKRFMASLLAVVMIFSVVGISPAVFADDAVAPELKANSGEVIIKSDMTNDEVAQILNKALISNYDELDDATKASLQWEYEGYGYTKNGVPSAKKHWGTINGNALVTTVNYGIGKAEYYNRPLKDSGAGNYQVRLAGTTTEATLVKVDKYSTKVELKADASITYNMDAAAEKEAIVASVIDYEKSNLPEGTTAADFTVQLKTGITELDIAYDNVPDTKINAGDGNVIRVKYNGNDTYKESGWAKATITVAKATVKVSVTPITTIYAGEEIDRDNFYTLDPNDPELDVYVLFVGVNSNMESCVNIKLSKDQEKLIDAISNAQEKWYDIINDTESLTLKEKLQEGITFGELKEIINGIVNNKTIMGILELAGYDTEAIKNIVTALDQLTSLSDDTIIAIGTPAHAGVYVATAVAVGKNYETSEGTGSLIVLKNWKGITLEKNPILNSGEKANTITVSQANELAKGNNLCILTKDGEALNNASAGSIHYWFTGVGKLYAKSAMPTAPGKYIVTASVRGGDFFAMPKTFTFTIVADPTPEVTPEA
ncbi:MAG: hypothetical protein PUE37_07590 [Firmicutes bacterium]|nr:hypothetical protein [Bacillota bacterium]